MRRIINLLVVLSSALVLAGCEGDQGPRGLTGPAGADGADLTAEQILEKLLSVDGTGSGLDADLVGGQDLGGVLDRVAALEAQVAPVADLQARIEVLEVLVESLQAAAEQQTHEVLYAWDGENRLLGRVVSVELQSVIYFDQAVGLPVEVFFSPVLAGEESIGLHQARMYYNDPDCEQATPNHIAYVRADSASTGLGILDQNTGLVWVRNEAIEPANRNLGSIRHLGIIGAGSCETIGSFTTFQEYWQARTIEPFTAGVFVRALR